MYNEVQNDLLAVRLHITRTTRVSYSIHNIINNIKNTRGKKIILIITYGIAYYI